MFETWIHPVTVYLTHHPTQGGLIAFSLAFLESLAIIGSIIPGSVTMTAVGSLIGLTVLPLASTVMWTIVGALIGDYVSYWVGIHYQETIRHWSWIQKHEKWFAKAESFVTRYGILSIIIGRFFGPMRSMMPMIAGILNMPPLTFTFAIIPSAILWTIVYLFPGILLGALSIDFPNTIPLNIIGYSLLILVILALVIKTSLILVHRYKENINTSFKNMITTLHLQKLPLVSHDLHDANVQLQHLILTSLYAASFCIISIWVTQKAWIIQANVPLYVFMQSLHTPWLNHFMQLITFLADKKVLFSTALFSATLMLLQKSKRKLAFTWLAYMISAAIIIKMAKLSMHIERPPILAPILGHTSFPSGHISYLTALLGFVALLIEDIAPTMKQKRWIYHLSWFVPIFIAITRLYLGAHWLTDIIGGFLLGWSIAHLGVALIYPQIKKIKIPYQLLKLSAIIWVLSACIYANMHFHNFYQNTFPDPKHFSLSTQQWKAAGSVPLSYIRYNRFGHPRDILNIRWADRGAHIMHILNQHHWKCINFPEEFFMRMWLKLTQKNYRGLPLLIPHYKGQAPIMIAVKHQTHNSHAVIFLWPSHHFYHNQPIWIGSIYTTQKRKNSFPTWGKRLYHLNPMQVLFKHQPHLLRIIPQKYWAHTQLNWDGHLILLHHPWIARGQHDNS
jgi:membrane protein DedA with SNARE-associated domain/membrane-associated phospholipid phosphatase